MTEETTHTFCRLCEVMCGLAVTVTDGEITKVRPDRDHPVSQGFACNKGLLTLDVHRDPDRLDHPMRRTASGWEQVSWADATTEVADRLRDVIDRHGPEAVAVYIGNPNAFNPLAGPAAAMFLLSLGSGLVFSSATVDCANKFTVSRRSSTARPTSTRSPTSSAPTTCSCWGRTRASRSRRSSRCPTPSRRCAG